MGGTLQWREPPRRDARDFERVIEFGRGRRHGRGFLAYSERAGPGVLLLHPPPSWAEPVLGLARLLHDDGFTVLVPDLMDDVDRDGSAERERLGAAAEHLADNWHPRLGVVGFAAAAGGAASLSAGGKCDALVVYGPESTIAAPVEVPCLAHFQGHAEAAGLWGAPEGDVELYLYSGENFIDPASEGFVGSEAHEAHERSLEFLRYHLS